MKSEDNGERLAAALVEHDRLRSENERLRKLLRVREVCPQIISASEMEDMRHEVLPDALVRSESGTPHNSSLAVRWPLSSPQR